ncbi:hypothetical protein F2P81_024742 [Scophthalmus maximus]|uniref:Uncharacterized protein n=1 Tax=Scophthalmus maximus TaxID=52904 RepID=A0A6A4RUB4_SCOMX|nr:hypothetical protein F2P81_024742 [Scophthalmus maximus]
MTSPEAEDEEETNVTTNDERRLKTRGSLRSHKIQEEGNDEKTAWRPQSSADEETAFVSVQVSSSGRSTRIVQDEEREETGETVVTVK